jgi:hypothetical protein
MRVLLAALGIVVVVGLGLGAEPVTGHQKKVKVSAATRIDWTFVLANRSLAEPPGDWLGDYDSGRQQYDLFVPANYSAKQSWPLVLYISPGDDPGAFQQLEPACRQLGMLLAAPYGAGNSCPQRRRVRIVLDVLDDIRRHYRIDPDRTYISGFSGGGRIACGIGFSLPEYFGGVMPICAAGDLRQEPWLRQRVIDRLSVALVSGESDFNRGECERWRGPVLRDVGVRTRVWVVPKLGHSVPAATVLQEALGWLEEDLKRRQELGQRYPASRIAADAAPARADWAKTLLTEGKQRLAERATLYSGLMQLKGCLERWPDLPAAAEAKKILLDYEARQDRPWEADDIAEQRRFLLANARGLGDYAAGPLPQQYLKFRGDFARQALQLWELILQDSPNSPAGAEARKRIPELQKLVDQ